jgi:hypothetical protein
MTEPTSTKKKPQDHKPKATVKPEPDEVPEAPLEDLTVCDLPGGFRAYWYEPDDLTERQERPLSIMLAYMMPKIAEVARAGTVVSPAGEVQTSAITGATVGLSMDDLDNLFQLNDLVVFTYLRRWTLKKETRDEDGEILTSEPWPLPPTVDDLAGWVPKPVYMALLEHAGKIQNRTTNTADGFSVDAVEDADSPTDV